LVAMAAKAGKAAAAVRTAVSVVRMNIGAGR
jgi:hypothetical protein